MVVRMDQRRRIYPTSWSLYYVHAATHSCVSRSTSTKPLPRRIFQRWLRAKCADIWRKGFLP